MKAHYFLHQLNNYLEEKAKEDWTRFIDEDAQICIDQDAMLHEAIQTLLEKSDENMVHILVQMPQVQSMFEDMLITIGELRDDAILWHNAQNRGAIGILQYHGLSMNDFI